MGIRHINRDTQAQSFLFESELAMTKKIRVLGIVSPRPNVLWEVKENRKWQYERLEGLPGIIRLAQVWGREIRSDLIH
jgi:lipopolysaccharide/colanic/teichoic acid biosynthesis glycosyltransferase